MPTKTKSVTGQNMHALSVQQTAHTHHYRTHPAQTAKISMIATPIGNLADITPRARDALERCDELWCEDTRHTQNLLNALHVERKGDGQRLRRVDQHTDPQEIEKLLAQTQERGQWIGVVTDAGTPGISDPGAKITEKISRFPGIKIEPIPGPSALSAFVSIAGLPDNSFRFLGFFPREQKDALELLANLEESSSIFFESPKRIRETADLLKLWCETLDFIPKFCFAKELTKIHETVVSGEGTAFIEFFLQQDFDERGEWVFSVVLPNDYLKNKKVLTDWELTLECLIEAEIPTKNAAQIVSRRCGIAKNLAYQTALELQKK